MGEKLFSIFDADPDAPAERSLDDFKTRYCTGEFSSLYVTFNDQACSYVKPGDEFFQMEYIDRLNWPSDAEKQLALKTNSIWEIQWYPHTPIGSYSVGGASFEAALDHAYAVAAESERERA